MITKKDKADWLENPVSMLFLQIAATRREEIRRAITDLVINSEGSKLEENLNVIRELKGQLHMLDDILEIKDFIESGEIEDE